MSHERRVKLLRSGRHQVVRIPREFELPGSEAVLRQVGARLVIEPVLKPSLLAVISQFKPLKASMPDDEDKQPETVDL